MKFISKLEWLMEQKNVNKHTLAQKSGIPYTTIVGLFERGPENARLSTLNKLCSFFDVPLDYLAMDEYDRPEDFTPNGKTVDAKQETLTSEEAKLLSYYRSMNKIGKEMLMQSASGFAGNPSMQEDVAKEEMA